LSILLADGFNRAFLGLGHKAASPSVAVYDYDRCAKILVRRDGMDIEEAYEFLDFNVVGSYVGDMTPIFLQRSTLREVKENES
jgi:hypothetical protein|tara:strand:+ start:1009 stop:1257 length:249 start_codon:yes stop_codon:yes gene_type:complete